jgi:hypothetical protein
MGLRSEGRVTYRRHEKDEATGQRTTVQTRREESRSVAAATALRHGSSPRGLSPSDVLSLQRTAGNAAVAKMLGSPGVTVQRRLMLTGLFEPWVYAGMAAYKASRRRRLMAAPTTEATTTTDAATATDAMATTDATATAGAATKPATKPLLGGHRAASAAAPESAGWQSAKPAALGGAKEAGPEAAVPAKQALDLEPEEKKRARQQIVVLKRQIATINKATSPEKFKLAAEKRDEQLLGRVKAQADRQVKVLEGRIEQIREAYGIEKEKPVARPVGASVTPRAAA